MTSNALRNKKSAKDSFAVNTLCITVTLITLVFSDRLKAGIYEGMLFSFSAILPTLFPFFIISDLWQSFFIVKSNSPFTKLFTSLFGIGGQSARAFVIGIICGFPIGAKASADLYNKNLISLPELELLSCISNTPSAAFVISGVGLGVFRDVKIGVILYISVIFSSIAVGILFRIRKIKYAFLCNNSEQKFNLASSIKSAGISSINVSSFIILFSGILKMIKGFANNSVIMPFIAAFLEIGNAVKEISSSVIISHISRLLLIAFSLGFSGLSVYFQALLFLPEEVNKRKYLLMKLIQGIFCSFIFYLLFLLIL